ncbi:hypothetical protein S83_043821 [Arachis hypogaea]
MKDLVNTIQCMSSKVDECEGRQQQCDDAMSLLGSVVNIIQQNLAKLTSEKAGPGLRVCAICKRMQADNEASDANGLFGDREHPFVKTYTSIYGDPDDYDTMFPITIADDHDTPVFTGNIPLKGAPEYQSQTSVSGNWGYKVIGEGSSSQTGQESHSSRIAAPNLISGNGLHFSSQQGASSFFPGENFSSNSVVPDPPRFLLIGRPTKIQRKSVGISHPLFPRKGTAGNSSKSIVAGGIHHGKGLAPNRAIGMLAPAQKAPPSNSLKLFRSQLNTAKPPDTTLSDLQIKVATYDFDLQADPMDELVKLGEVVVRRKELLTLRPGKMSDDVIFDALTMRLTLGSQTPDGPTFWCLPPSFANDVLEAKLLAERVRTYKDTWMKPSHNLAYAYIPVKDISSHWYLMVVAFNDMKLYHFDACIGDEKSTTRKIIIRNLGDVLSRIISTPAYPAYFRKRARGVMCFGIAEPDGLASCQSRHVSAACVLNWMAMGGFQRKFIQQVDDKSIRMQTALGLLLLPFNEERGWIGKFGISPSSFLLVPGQKMAEENTKGDVVRVIKATGEPSRPMRLPLPNDLLPNGSNHIYITVTDGSDRTYKIACSPKGWKEITLGRGWQRFYHEYKLQPSNILLFKHKGRDDFSVRIF